jgi:mono/diheme cytochrome c family protein
MLVAQERLRKLGCIAMAAADVVVALLLLSTASLIWLEQRWNRPTFRDAEQAFRHGTIGTELMPLPLAYVLGDLKEFDPAGDDGGDWIERFGFIRNDEPGANSALPIGFVVSNYRPSSGAPSPLPFVGFSCALCHTTRLRGTDGGPGKIIYGPGSVSLNLFSWIDAFQSALLAREPPPAGTTADPAKPPPYRLTAKKIIGGYEAKIGQKLDLLQQGMVVLWLQQIRTKLEDGLARFDDPYGLDPKGHSLSRDPQYVPTGPTRTQPFRTLIRNVFDRPGNDMPVYTKIATVFSKDLRHWSQFDGTIANLYARSSLAALAAGATVDNMNLPEIADNIRKASDYTATLRPRRFDALFPQQAATDAGVLARGREVYREHCFDCHGDRDAATSKWSNGPRAGEVVPLAQIKTDPERVSFRHYGEVGNRLFAAFPAKHPFHFPRDEIKPAPGEEDNLAIRGYVNGAMDGMFLRAPYLHNASILTLAELINLKKRRDVFYRGHNRYDPIDVGFQSPDAPDRETYFKFDTSLPGNSNVGHNYPWPYEPAKGHVEELTVLLAYLKAL